jgi:Lectin C-type domain
VSDADADENAAATVVVFGARASRAWFGLREIKAEGPFEWIDGTPLNYTNWDSATPVDFTCSSIAADGTWGTSECTSTRKAIYVVEFDCV